MLTIPLYGRNARGRVALIDDQDYEIISANRWWVWEYPNPGGRMAGPYAYSSRNREDGVKTSIRMHQLITGLPKVDHVNGNGLDNQRHNLRDGSDGVNERNARKRKDGSSSYKGVSWDRANRIWRARIQFSGKQFFLGHFADEETAAIAYDVAAVSLFGEAALLNFQR